MYSTKYEDTIATTAAAAEIVAAAAAAVLIYNSQQYVLNQEYKNEIVHVQSSYLPSGPH